MYNQSSEANQIEKMNNQKEIYSDIVNIRKDPQHTSQQFFNNTPPIPSSSQPRILSVLELPRLITFPRLEAVSTITDNNNNNLTSQQLSPNNPFQPTNTEITLSPNNPFSQPIPKKTDIRYLCSPNNPFSPQPIAHDVKQQNSISTVSSGKRKKVMLKIITYFSRNDHHHIYYLQYKKKGKSWKISRPSIPTKYLNYLRD
ncbi:uncharacterized protein LOC125769175 isoform X2 [Anopheles funestus]|uniref:uncharacterized protein LOC125769175 isoform X2 n=1 Tax=Anopheles funestus TaxID=62324 RepID=UPI0020C5FAD5|nr:uncharacterized protein LOC125769175 isoform X2 [Anopheles funestus]